MKPLMTALLLTFSAAAIAQAPPATPRTAPKPMAGSPTPRTNPTPARDTVADATRTAVLDDKDLMDPALQAIEADRKDDAARRAAAAAQPPEPEEDDER